MDSNGDNNFEDADMAEGDDEKVVTMMDVLQEQQNYEDDANAVLGASDEKNCTYSKGYIKRQAIYACLTCCSEAKYEESKRAGVCLACSINCHENHELIELYTKRNFRCDCGNPKFNSNSCIYTPNKIDLNEENIYNQNFSGLYCNCHRPYPDPETNFEDEMIQCIICEDWLHASHLDAVVPGNDQYSEMICKTCMEKNEFLHDYSNFAANVETEDLDITGNDLDGKQNGDLKTETLVNGTGENTTEKDKDDMNVDETQTENISATEINSTPESQTSENLIEDNKVIESNGRTMEVDESVKVLGAPSDVNTDPHDDTNAELATSKEHSQIPEETTLDSQNSEENEGSKPEKTEVDLPESAEDLKVSMETSTNAESVENSSENTLDSKAITETSESAKSEETPPEKPEEEELEAITDISEFSKPETIANAANDPQVNAEELKTTPETSQQQEETKEGEEGILNQDKHDLEKTEINDDKSTENINPPETTSDVVPVEQKTDAEKDKGDETENLDSEDFDNNQEEITPNENDDSTGDTNKVNAENDDKPTDITNNTEIKDAEIDSTSENAQAQNESNADNSGETESTKPSDEATKTEETNNSLNKEDELLNEPTTEANPPLDKIEIPNNTEENKDNKRKLATEEATDDILIKKAKLDEENKCIRPKGIKKVHKGATFWPSNFRQQLCTCNECISMYKDLSVLFLTDSEDTITAYERLGKERVNGRATQYEIGLEALSSLDRTQQINAMTEYNKMKDKLLDFLKRFKDRREIVKEEDIKAFFAGMKPKRESDGVYFCR